MSEYANTNPNNFVRLEFVKGLLDGYTRAIITGRDGSKKSLLLVKRAQDTRVALDWFSNNRLARFNVKSSECQDWAYGA